MPRHPFYNIEHLHTTVRHQTVHYNLTCLRVGAQAHQKSSGEQATPPLTKTHDGTNIYGTVGQVKRGRRLSNKADNKREKKKTNPRETPRD